MMDTTTTRSRLARALAIGLIAGAAAAGLAGCQTASQVEQPAPRTAPDPRPLDDGYRNLPADRIEQRLRDDAGEPGCILQVIVEHVDGSYRLECAGYDID